MDLDPQGDQPDLHLEGSIAEVDRGIQWCLFEDYFRI